MSLISTTTLLTGGQNSDLEANNNTATVSESAQEDNCIQSLVKPVFYFRMDDKKDLNYFSKRKEI